MFHSPHPPVEIPDQSIYDYLFGSLDDDDLDRVALVDPASGAETTYRALRAQVDAFAGALAAPRCRHRHRRRDARARTCPRSRPCSTAS